MLHAMSRTSERLLADEVMEPVLKSAGLEPQQFRDMLLETARRFEDRERPATSGEGTEE